MDANEFTTTVSGLWGAADPDHGLLAAARAGVTGSPHLLIDGRLTGASDGGLFQNLDPSTERPLGVTADATGQDIDRAVRAARRAFDTTTWSRDVEFRRRCLLQLHAALERAIDELRVTAMAEIGVGIRTTIGFHSDGPLALIPYFADLAGSFEYEAAAPEAPWAGDALRLIRHEPVGVVAAITPWNYPLYTAMTKLIPALAAGNTVVFKPAPQTPWHATLIARLAAEETDLPAGVLNVVPTSDNAVAELLTTHPDVDLVHFTGSTAVGRRIQANASDRIGRVALELGGKSPNLVLDDADLEQVVPVAAALACMNSGQGCILPTRLLVPESRYEECVELARFGFEHFPYGDPRDPRTMQGPQVSERQQQRVLGYIATGVEEGARLVTGGRRPPHLPIGYYVEPTLLADVDPASTVAQEEIFGPVQVVIPYRDEDHAVEIANGTRYGLAGTVWSSDESRALDVARRIRSGALSINGGNFYQPDLPTGGMKQSGIGRESGLEGFHEFLQTKTLVAERR